ncbi:MAG: T9SS type A sorting domain-containing protein [Candidatus Kapabacteria bacterium]|nr:T9SS type A sorting domain-containing protein [Candidatus Kapabacteria bacterium]
MIVKYNGTSFIKYDSTNFSLNRGFIRAFKIDKFSNVWFSIFKYKTNNDTLIKFDGANFINVYPSDSTYLGHVEDICWDTTGIMWLATTNGLYKYDGADWTNINTSNSPLPSNSCGPIICDHKNNLWFASGKSVCVYNPAGIQYNISEVIEKPDGSIEHQASPNPSTGMIIFDFALPWPAVVKIDIYDENGTNVANIQPQNYNMGHNSYIFDGSNLANGTYNYRLKTNDKFFSGRFVVLR